MHLLDLFGLSFMKGKYTAQYSASYQPNNQTETACSEELKRTWLYIERSNMFVFIREGSRYQIG